MSEKTHGLRHKTSFEFNSDADIKIGDIIVNPNNFNKYKATDVNVTNDLGKVAGYLVSLRLVR